MRKNKVNFINIKNLIMLIMVIGIMAGIYYNVRFSKAEDTIELQVELIDKQEKVPNEEISLNVKNTNEENYEINLPKVANGKFVTFYYLMNDEQINYNENEEVVYINKNMVQDKKITLKVDYDRKEVKKETVNQQEESKTTEQQDETTEQQDETTEQQDETTEDNLEKQEEITEDNKEEQDYITLYNKRILYADEITIEGYMPLEAHAEIKEINPETELTNIDKSSVKNIIKAYDIKIISYEEEYQPEQYKEKLNIKFKANTEQKTYTIFHVNEEKKEIEKLDTTQSEQEVEALADKFSVYLLSEDENTTSIIGNVEEPKWTTSERKVDIANDQITFKLTGTDAYFKNSTLTNSQIEVYVDGVNVTNANGITVDIGTESQIANGVEYNVTLSGYNIDCSQIKIKILANTIKDQTENGNKETEIILYNCLKKSIRRIWFGKIVFRNTNNKKKSDRECNI